VLSKVKPLCLYSTNNGNTSDICGARQVWGTIQASSTDSPSYVAKTTDLIYTQHNRT